MSYGASLARAGARPSRPAGSGRRRSHRGGHHARSDSMARDSSDPARCDCGFDLLVTGAVQDHGEEDPEVLQEVRHCTDRRWGIGTPSEAQPPRDLHSEAHRRRVARPLLGRAVVEALSSSKEGRACSHSARLPASHSGIHAQKGGPTLHVITVNPHTLADTATLLQLSIVAAQRRDHQRGQYLRYITREVPIHKVPKWFAWL